MLGGHQLRAVRAVGQRVELGRRSRCPGAQPGQLLGLARGGLLGRLPLGPGQLDGRLDPRDGPPGSLGHGAGDGRVAAAPGQPGGRPLAGLALGGSGAGQCVPAARDGPHPLLERAHLEPGLHLRGASHAAPRAEPADVRGRGVRAARGAGPRRSSSASALASRRSRSSKRARVGLPGPLRGRDRGCRAARPLRWRPGPRRPAGRPGRRLSAAALSAPCSPACARARTWRARSSSASAPASSRSACSQRCSAAASPAAAASAAAAGLQQARRLRRPALGPVRPEQVSLPGDHPQPGVGSHQVPGLAEVGRHDDVAEAAPAAARAAAAGARTRSSAARAPAGRTTPAAGRVGAAPRSPPGSASCRGSPEPAITSPAPPASSPRSAPRIVTASSRPATATASAAAPRAAAIACCRPRLRRSASRRTSPARRRTGPARRAGSPRRRRRGQRLLERLLARPQGRALPAGLVLGRAERGHPLARAG